MDLRNDCYQLLFHLTVSAEDGDKNKSYSKEMLYAKMLMQKVSETGDVREY